MVAPIAVGATWRLLTVPGLCPIPYYLDRWLGIDRVELSASAIERFMNAKTVAVDGGEGYAISDPDAETVADFERMSGALAEERAALERLDDQVVGHVARKAQVDGRVDESFHDQEDVRWPRAADGGGHRHQLLGRGHVGAGNRGGEFDGQAVGTGLRLAEADRGQAGHERVGEHGGQAADDDQLGDQGDAGGFVDLVDDAIDSEGEDFAGVGMFGAFESSSPPGGSREETLRGFAKAMR
jgi:hypothetical protein